MRRLRITESHDYDVVGTLLEGEGDSAPEWRPRPAELIQIG